MNSLSSAGLMLARPLAPPQSWWRAWRGPWLFALAAGLIIAAPALVSSFDFVPALKTPAMLVAQLIGPLLTSHLVLIAWMIATHGLTEPRARVRRLLPWVAAALAFDVVFTPWLLHDLLGLPDVYRVAFAAKGVEMPPAWLFGCAEFLASAMFATLAVALGERWRMRQDAAAALSRADADGAELRHRLVEARLAAMQAQVEPQFLFDTLVEIEAAYEHDAARAARALDRLIAFLRLALPGLRASGYMAGSTLTAELALVQAYLGVIDARGDISADWQIEIDAACAQAAISPMLLLPLVQSMVRCLVEKRLNVAVRAQCRDERALVIEMHAQGCTVHNDQPEFLHVRERLDALYDGRATLTSELREPAQTVLRLTLPQLA